MPVATLLHLLLHQDGSTTRLLQMLVGGPISVHVLDQGFVDEVPDSLADVLSGKRFLRRLISLEAGGYVLLDSISYIATDILPAPVVRDLEEGIRPIGSILADLWTRRRSRAADKQLLDELWAVTGKADPAASRACSILMPQGTCMVLAETFRRGVITVAATRGHAA